MKRLPKADYFRLRLQQAVDSGNSSKEDYYRTRLERLGEPNGVDSYVPPTASQFSGSDVVSRCVRVFLAPRGTMQQKHGYLSSQGVDETTILEALNIASGGALLDSV